MGPPPTRKLLVRRKQVLHEVPTRSSPRFHRESSRLMITSTEEKREICTSATVIPVKRQAAEFSEVSTC